jgi:molybdopterin converting factor subunit 1
MHVNVRLFARLRDLAGASELIREVPQEGTVEAVWRALVADFPQLGPYRTSVSSAVNAEYVRMSALVQEGDEVAFLPPVSGG